MLVLLTMLAVFAVLVSNEILWRGRKAHGEFSRKFVHITVGSFVAFWPFYLSWRQIEFLSLAFIVAVLMSKTLGIFEAIHSVQRPTWGELCFALAVGIVALLTHDRWVYMTSILLMGLADGLAAMVGVRFGRSNSYTVLGHSKSLAGTLTFFVSTVIILGVYAHFDGPGLRPLVLDAIALAASLLENASVQGLDNLTVPLLTALLLRH